MKARFSNFFLHLEREKQTNKNVNSTKIQSFFHILLGMYTPPYTNVPSSVEAKYHKLTSRYLLGYYYKISDQLKKVSLRKWTWHNISMIEKNPKFNGQTSRNITTDKNINICGQKERGVT